MTDNQFYIDKLTSELTALRERNEELEKALRDVDTCLDNFGYSRGMKARKIIATLNLSSPPKAST